MAAFIGIVVFELHIPESGSLKTKRKVVKGLVERLHQRLRVSVAETDHHDLHQRAEIAVAAVAPSEGRAEELLDRVREIVDRELGAVVTRWDRDVLSEAG